MDIIVKSKNCEVPARLKDEAVERVEHATRIFDRLVGVEMVFSEEHNPRISAPAVVEVTARTKGHQIRAEGAGEDHRAAIDIALARFERQLERYKSRLIDRNRRPRATVPDNGGLVAPSVGQEQDQAAGQGTGQPMRPGAGHGADPDDGPRIVRSKRFELHAMVPEDAVWQLELLGHEFYLFTNAMTGQANVVYRRRDGDYGLIEPA